MVNRETMDSHFEGSQPYWNGVQARDSGSQIYPISHNQPTLAAVPPMMMNYQQPVRFSQFQQPTFHHIQTVPFSPHQSRFGNASAVTQVQQFPVPAHYIPHYSRV